MSNWEQLTKTTSHEDQSPGGIDFHLTKEEREFAIGAKTIAKARIAGLNRREEARMLAAKLEEMGNEE